MVQWVVKAWQAEATEELEEQDVWLQMIESQHCSSVKWKLITLNNLFSDTRSKPMHPLRTIEGDRSSIEQAIADDGALTLAQTKNISEPLGKFSCTFWTPSQ